MATTIISFLAPADWAEQLSDIARARKIDRSKLIRECIVSMLHVSTAEKRTRVEKS